MSKKPTRPRIARPIPADDADTFLSASPSWTEAWEIKPQEVELLIRWRQLPRHRQKIVYGLLEALSPPADGPLVSLVEVADIYHLSVTTLRRKCSEGSFSPLPCRKYPYLWRREDIQRDITGPSKRLPRRAHGFAATKVRRLTA